MPSSCTNERILSIAAWFARAYFRAPSAPNRRSRSAYIKLWPAVTFVVGIAGRPARQALHLEESDALTRFLQIDARS
jgi:hypothetical protein